MTTGNAEHITVDAALRPSRTTMTATANTAKHASVTRVRAALPTRSLLDDDDEEEEEVQETERHAVHSKAAPNVTNNGDTTMQHSPTGTTTSSTASLVDWNRNATNNNNNKRRHTLALGSNANANANGTKNKKRPLPYAWDDFVRTGTRLKSLFGHAMHHVQTTVAVVATTTTPGKRMRTNNNNNNNDDDEDEGDQHQQKQHQDTDYTAELAREKMEQVMLLQRVRITVYYKSWTMLERCVVSLTRCLYVSVCSTHVLTHNNTFLPTAFFTHTHAHTATQGSSGSHVCLERLQRFLARRGSQ
jgi:hypothetical protein